MGEARFVAGRYGHGYAVFDQGKRVSSVMCGTSARDMATARNRRAALADKADLAAAERVEDAVAAVAVGERLTVQPVKNGFAVFRGDAQVTAPAPSSTTWYRRKKIAEGCPADEVKGVLPTPTSDMPWADRGRHRVAAWRGEYAVWIGPRRISDRLEYGQARSLAGMLNKADAEAAKPQRPCITCGTPFASEGAHNRMCGTCRCRAKEDVQANPYSRGVSTGLSRRA